MHRPDETHGLAGADYVEYRHRDGRSNICDNASVTHLEETLDGTGNLLVISGQICIDAQGKLIAKGKPAPSADAVALVCAVYFPRGGK